MATKVIYTAVAVAGIAAASVGAWWLQHKPAKPTGEVALAPLGDPASGARGARAVTDSSASPRAGSGPGGASGARGTPSVEVARVEVVRITDDAQAVGTLRSRQSVVLRPEVSGRVTKINFRDGQRVKRGQLLVQLDDQLPLAQVKQAEAELSIARANQRRNEELLAQNFVARRAVDEGAANVEVAQAKLALAQATLQRLRILAPFDGIAGIRSISVGDYLKDGADIVNIEDLDAVFVDFRLPERFQTKVQRGQTALVDFDALPGMRYAAVIQAIDPLLDQNGRSVGVRGCIDNRKLQLRPGMFARITTVFGVRDQARVVPEEAIVPQGGRQYVYRLAVGPDQDTRIAQRVEVRVGVRQPGRVEILEGLNPGDMVVTAGQQRIQKDGTPVRVVELGKGTAPANGAAVMGVRRPQAGEAAAASVSASGAGNPCNLSKT